MLWCDNETAGPSPAATSKCCMDFMAELVTLFPGNPHGVYTFIDFAKQGNCAGAGKYPLWLAYPNLTAPQAPPPWVKWAFWQWGTRNGIDADAFNGTVAQLDAWIASFAPVPSGPYKHTTDGKSSVTQIAATRGMRPGNWLALQDKLTGSHTAADALGGATVAAGLPWYSITP
jgi:hypothetical protein